MRLDLQAQQKKNEVMELKNLPDKFSGQWVQQEKESLYLQPGEILKGPAGLWKFECQCIWAAVIRYFSDWVDSFILCFVS